ncbi:MAG: winged helix-turn-helix transcriptional regulator [Gemmatimonadetes bacterium]|nr:winged helix-turn-helix transcriptional regulator [Gemmatimonadota bacterium]
MQHENAKHEEFEAVWKALANRTRREILDLLRDGPMTTTELTDSFPALSRFSVMQHLRVLEQGNLLVRRKAGRKRFHHLNPIPLQQIYHRWVAQWQEPWAESLVALKGELERREAGSRTREPKRGA